MTSISRRDLRAVLCAGVVGVLATVFTSSPANARSTSVTVRPPYGGGVSSSYEGGSSSCEAPNPFDVDCMSTSSWSPEGALVSELEVDSGAQGAVARPMYAPVHDQY